MTRDETVALFMECEAKRAEARKAALDQGKSENEAETLARDAAKRHWNAWAEALLAERKAMEADGRWDAGHADWTARAETDFSFCLFLDKVGVNEEKEAGLKASIKKKAAEAEIEARSLLGALVDKRATEAETDFRSIPVDTEVADFDGFVFPAKVRFDSAAFSGNTSFDGATFSGEARFENAIFSGNALFESATFWGEAKFDRTSFSGYALFDRATFSDEARFDRADFSGAGSFYRSSFSGNASFVSVAFSSEARFDRASFSGDAWFDSATFSDEARFDHANFSGEAVFDRATFSRNALFWFATFSGDALFDSVTFAGYASFDSATFSCDASFRGQTFSKDVFFNKTRFGPGSADFGLATFERVVQFDGAQFTGEADFNAVSGKRTFSMSSARFEGVPNFIQAHFEEAPRLDNVVVTPPKNSERLSADEALDLFARWRELRRLAIQAHDTDRELEFNAQEIRAERAASRWPIPNKAQGWKIWLRSFLGWLYGFFSDYGRSLFWPFLWWIVAIAISAAIYLSQTEAMQTGRYAMWQSVPCYPAPTSPPPIYAETWRNNWKMWEKPKAGAASSNEAAELEQDHRWRPQRKAAQPDQRPRRGAAPRLPQRLRRARRRQRRLAPHVWLPLRPRNVCRAEPRAHRAERRLHRQRHPEADLGRLDLPVRPRAAQHAEGEMTSRRHGCPWKLDGKPDHDYGTAAIAERRKRRFFLKLKIS